MTPAAYNAQHAATSRHGITPADLGASSWADTDAIAAWQRAHGLEPDGRFGPASVKAFRASQPEPGPAFTAARGIDVSGNNKAFKLDPAAFKKVAAAGYSFVYIKAAQAGGYTFARLAEWVDLALEAGLDVGVYQFDVPRQRGSAARDADYFLDAIRGLPTTLRPVLDHEEAHQCKRIPVPGKPGKVMPDPRYKLDSEFLAEWALTFLRAVEAETGHPPTFYTYAAWLKGRRPAFLARPALARSPLWLAKVGTVPPRDVRPFPSWACWQDSWTTVIPGLDGHVDTNLAPRGLDELRIPGGTP